MLKTLLAAAALTSGLACAAGPVLAQTRETGNPATVSPPVGRPGATDALAMLDGVWIGPARLVGPDGTVHSFEQMERIGPMLGGEIRIMEGKARSPDGRTLFNAFTVFSAVEGGIEMRSHTPGRAGARLIELRPNGFVWRTAAGTGEMVYTIVIENGEWRETGVMVLPNGRVIPSFEMTLRRRGGTSWPRENPQFPVRDPAPGASPRH